MSKVITRHFIGDSDVSFVDAGLISIPFTQIVNRALIRNLAEDLGAYAGVERLMVYQAAEIQGEVGPANERVSKSLTDSLDRIRFVGNWTNVATSDGVGITSTGSGNDFVEITFFGTGLNVLISPTGPPQILPTINGGLEGANIVGSITAALGSRGFPVNTIVPVISGLSQGLHTIKLRITSQPARIFGFEFLNEVSTIRINSGSLIKDQKRVSLETAQTLLTKPSGLTGTKGGRIVVYNSGGQLFQAIQPVDVFAQYITATNHANEEISRWHSWREFGTGRTDDFNGLLTGTSGAKVFLLDDGVTALASGSGGSYTVTTANNKEGLSPNLTNDYLTITFIGTGLDIEISSSGASGDTMDVIIDGTTQLSGGRLYSGTARQVAKVASGLPYGTHVVKINVANGGLGDFYIHGFITYQPKKPSIPVGAVEIADYFVLADFVANTVSSGLNLGVGVLRKTAIREFTLANGSGGSSDWGTNYGYNTGDPATQWNLVNDGNGAYFEYTFVGTGFDYRCAGGGSGSSNITCTVNGTALNASFPGAGSINCSVYGGTQTYGGQGPNTSFLLSAVASNILVAGTTGSSNGLRISNLPFDKYTVRFTQSAAAGNVMRLSALDIITPIYSPKASTRAEYQNMLMIGNSALSDSRQIERNDAKQSKFRGVAVGVSSSPTTTSTTLIPMPEMSLTVVSNGEWFDLEVVLGWMHSNISQNMFVQFMVNGMFLETEYGDISASSGNIHNFKLTQMVYLPAGVHKVDAYWRTNTGTITANGVMRKMTVKAV